MLTNLKYEAVVVSTLAIMAMVAPAIASDGEVYTLYRNSVMDATMRVHVATFDAEGGKDYNAGNCAVVADLFQRQDGVKTRFWCEPGRYRK